MSALRVVKFSPRRRVRMDHLSLDETVRAAWASRSVEKRRLVLCGLLAALPRRCALQRRLWYFVDQMRLQQDNIFSIVGDDRPGA